MREGKVKQEFKYDGTHTHNFDKKWAESLLSNLDSCQEAIRQHLRCRSLTLIL